MGSWCAENLRDCKAWKDEGLQISGSSNEAAKLYDATLRQLVSWIDCDQLGGIISTTEQMLKAEPDSIIGRSLALGMDALGANRKLDATFASELDALVKDAEAKGNEREKRHARGVRFFANGEMSKACVEWEQILAEHPTDLQEIINKFLLIPDQFQAVKFSHDAYFFSGKTKQKLLTMNSVIEKWSPTLPCANYLHGMHAFALEENELYDKAEQAAKKALEIQRHDAWAIHAMAHCKEMNGQYQEGIKFMESTQSDWMPCWMITCHNYWHTALFYLEQADFDAVLSIYDKEIAERSHSKVMLDLVDAASLLTRLEMEGIQVGKERWKNLVPCIDKHIDSHVLAFNDAHLSMILANAEDKELQQKHLKSIENFIGSANKGNENRQNTELYGQKICESIGDFKNEKFADCFNRLYPIKDHFRQIGGSNAQRDVFVQLLINSGLQSDSQEHKDLALGVLAERNRLKKNSLVSDRIVQRHKITSH